MTCTQNFILALLLLVGSLSVSAQQLSTLPNVSGVTGAVVNESTISNIYYVRAQGGNNSNSGKSSGAALQTIFAAVQKAVVDLKSGTPTKILISEGTYRESLGTVDFGTGAGQNALFVMEGAPGEKVIISGSDAYTEWKSVSNGLYAHPWTNDWGNLWIYDKFVDATLLAHRSEMVFVNGKPLRQQILEDYSKTGKIYDTYTGYTDPQQALTPGTFGVAERDENGNKLFIKPASGTNVANAQVEVASRRIFAKFTAKDGFVIRNLTVQHFANTIGPGYDFQYVIEFANGSKNLLIERSTFQWNNQFTLRLKNINQFTLRNCVFQYNGGSGQDASFLTNSLFENNTTNFNNWRNYLGGATEWFLSGFKHQTNTDQIMRGHTAVGNLAAGCWWDISNKNQHISKVVSVLNHSEGFFYEISEGPMVLEKSLIALNALSESSNLRNTSGVQTTFRNNIIYSNVAYEGTPTETREGNFRTTMYDRTQPGDASRGVDKEEVAQAKMTTLRNVIMGGEQEGFTWYFSENADGFFKEDYQGKDNYFYHASGNSEDHFRAGRWDDAPIRDYEGYLAWAGTSETNSRFEDPGFENAAGLDFRFKSSSPLKNKEADYLAIAIDPQVLRQCQEFWDWIGYDQKVPVASGGGGENPSEPTAGNVTVRARGTSGSELIEIRYNNQRVGDRITLSTSYQEYAVTVNNPDGNFKVAFVNDASGRDVYVDWLEVGATKRQAEDQSINTGAWANGTCGGGTRTEVLHCNGYIDFGAMGGASSSEGSIVVRAKSSVGSEQMRLLIDGVVKKSWTVATTPADYSYEGYSGGRIVLRFDNDGSSNGQDRNLAINYVDVCGERQEAEGASNSASANCSSTSSGFVWLWCNASLNFGNVGCNSSARQVATVDKLETKATINEWFRSYPNPISEHLTVEGSEDYQVVLYDLSGQAVMRHDHLKGNTTLNVRHLRPGVYVLKMSGGLHPQLRQRIVVE